MSERITEHSIELTQIQPFNPELVAISFPQVLKENPFPPISFLFRRSLYEEIGRFDESLPVLGDWEFNLRALASSPIAMIPQILANYHHRTETKSTYSNSVTAGDEKHRTVEKELRERWEQHNPFYKIAVSFAAYSNSAAASSKMKRQLHQLKNNCFSLPQKNPTKG